MEKQGSAGVSKSVLIIIIVVALLVVGGMGAFAYGMYQKAMANSGGNNNVVNNNENSAVVGAAGDGIVVSKDNLGEVKQELENLGGGQIVVKLTGNWLFTDGCTKSNAYIGNSEYNDFPMSFVISLEDTGEVILQSPEVPVGSCIQNFPLDVELEPGNYSVIITHQKLVDGEVYSSVNTAATIVVQ